MRSLWPTPSRASQGGSRSACAPLWGLECRWDPAGLYGAVAQAFEDCSPVLVIIAGVPQGSGGHTHYDMVRGFQSVTKWVGTVDKDELIPDFAHRAFTKLRSGRPGPVRDTLSRQPDPEGRGLPCRPTLPRTPVKYSYSLSHHRSGCGQPDGTVH
jgi:hypothetical protein